MLAVHRKSKNYSITWIFLTKTFLTLWLILDSTKALFEVIFLVKQTSTVYTLCCYALCFSHTFSTLFCYSLAVCWPAIWPLLHPFLCKKRGVHHHGHQLVQLRQPLEPQGLLRYWQAQSSHVSWHTCTHAESLTLVKKLTTLTFLNICSHPHFRITVYLCWVCLDCS